MAHTWNEVVEKSMAKVNAGIETAKAALASNNMDAYEEARAALDGLVKDLNQQVRGQSFAVFMADENPLMAAIKKFYITSYRAKEKRDEETGKTIGIELAKNDKTRIDFDAFCKFANLDSGWLRDCTCLLQLLQLRKTDIYNMSASELSAQSYFFMNAVRQKKEGKTPDSNTQIVALLQKIVDATIFEEGKNGGNAHKCTHRDIAFIEDCAHQFDPKAQCGIKSLKPRGFQTVMASVLYSMVTGVNYTVKNAKISEKALNPTAVAETTTAAA